MPEFGNALLDSLSPDEIDELRPHLRPMDLKRGDILIEQGAEVSTVHFPIDAQLANVIVSPDDVAIETAIIGQEGVSGLAPFMAEAACGWRCAVRSPGRALAVAAPRLRAIRKRSEAFELRLLRLSSFYQAQAAQTAACNASHTVLPRVARWLATAADLTPGAPVVFTQDEIALLLGAQRTTVQDAMARLRDSGAIRYGRGAITVADPERLRREACGCYRVLGGLANALGVQPAPNAGPV